MHMHVQVTGGVPSGRSLANMYEAMTFIFSAAYTWGDNKTFPFSKMFKRKGFQVLPEGCLNYITNYSL